MDFSHESLKFEQFFKIYFFFFFSGEEGFPQNGKYCLLLEKSEKKVVSNFHKILMKIM